MFVVGALVEWLIARKLYRQDHLDHVLVTFGLILIFDTLVHLLWGASGMAIPLPDALNGQLTIGGLVLPTYLGKRDRQRALSTYREYAGR